MMMLDVSTCSFLYNKMKACDSVTSTKLAKYYILEILPDVHVLCILPAAHVDCPNFVDANKLRMQVGRSHADFEEVTAANGIIDVKWYAKAAKPRAQLAHAPLCSLPIREKLSVACHEVCTLLEVLRYACSCLQWCLDATSNGVRAAGKGRIGNQIKPLRGFMQEFVVQRTCNLGIMPASGRIQDAALHHTCE